MNSDDAASFVRRVLDAVDARDPDRLAPFLADDVQFRSGNSPVVTGVRDVCAQFARSRDYFRAIFHDFQGLWRGQWAEGEVFSLEAVVSYELLDGRTLSLPCTSTLRCNRDGLIADYRIFMDPAPLLAG